MLLKLPKISLIFLFEIMPELIQELFFYLVILLVETGHYMELNTLQVVGNTFCTHSPLLLTWLTVVILLHVQVSDSFEPD